MRPMIPLLLAIGTGTYVFSYVPSHFNKGNFQFIPFLVMNTRFIQQKQQIPVAVLMIVTTSTRAIEIECAALWQNLLRHFLDVVDNL